MYAEAFLTEKLLHLGVVGLCRNKDDTWRLDFSAEATLDQQQQAAAYASAFDYSTVELALANIAALENMVTPRMLQEALGGDTTQNPAWCGGAGGTAAQHIAWLNQQKAMLRATLPR